jgi:hypothetical protein
VIFPISKWCFYGVEYQCFISRFQLSAGLTASFNNIFAIIAFS